MEEIITIATQDNDVLTQPLRHWKCQYTYEVSDVAVLFGTAIVASINPKKFLPKVGAPDLLSRMFARRTKQ